MKTLFSFLFVVLLAGSGLAQKRIIINSGNTVSLTTSLTLVDTGSAGQLLRSNGSSAPTWTDADSLGALTLPVSVANGGTGVDTLAPYSIILSGATSTAHTETVDTGTLGQTLVSGGGAAKPTFTNLTGALTMAALPCALDTTTTWAVFGSTDTAQAWRPYLTVKSRGSVGVAPMSLTMDNMYVQLADTCGATDTLTVTIWKSTNQGATWTSTGITVSIGGAGATDTYARDITHTATFSQGDMWSIELVGNATLNTNLYPTVSVRVR